MSIMIGYHDNRAFRLRGIQAVYILNMVGYYISADTEQADIIQRVNRAFVHDISRDTIQRVSKVKQKLQLSRVKVIQKCHTYYMSSKGGNMIMLLGLSLIQSDILHKVIGL